MAKMGRPKKEINQKTFESLCAIQCTREEICAVLEVSEDTLNRWCKRTYKKTFAATFQEKREGGKASLRRTQWRLAERSPAMAIFLGKNMLGQSDKDDYDRRLTEAQIRKIDAEIEKLKVETAATTQRNGLDNSTDEQAESAFIAALNSAAGAMEEDPEENLGE